MADRVITVNAAGVISGMHFDDFSLTVLPGAETVNVERASEITWSKEHGWSIGLYDETRLCPGELMPDALRGYDTYESARQFEVKFLQACRMAEVDPLSKRAEAMAADLDDRGDHGSESQ